jgi:hypothetical protein
MKQTFLFWRLMSFLLFFFAALLQHVLWKDKRYQKYRISCPFDLSLIREWTVFLNLIRRQWPSTRVYGQVGLLEGLEAGAQITSRTTDSTISGHPGAPNVIIRFDHAPK